MIAQSLRFIVAEGPIGAGKTTLARKLSQSFNAELIMGKPEDNSFLEKFYANSSNVALPTQLSFLLQRVRQLDEIRQSNLFYQTRIADFMTEKDRIFAQLNPDGDEYEIYEQLFQRFF